MRHVSEGVILRVLQRTLGQYYAAHPGAETHGKKQAVCAAFCGLLYIDTRCACCT